MFLFTCTMSLFRFAQLSSHGVLDLRVISFEVIVWIAYKNQIIYLHISKKVQATAVVNCCKLIADSYVLYSTLKYKDTLEWRLLDYASDLESWFVWVLLNYGINKVVITC